MEKKKGSMDFEALVYDLKPLLDTEKLAVDSVSLDHHLKTLDNLAVGLRSPTNRDLVGQSGLLLKLVRATVLVLGQCFDNTELSDGHSGNGGDKTYLRLASELVRCLANALVDNDNNRELFLHASSVDGSGVNVILSVYAGKILRMSTLNRHSDPYIGSLQMRTIVLIKNLCLENRVYTEQVGKFVRDSLLGYLRRIGDTLNAESTMESITLGAELLNDFVGVNPMGLTGQDIEFLCEIVERFSIAVISIEQGNKTEENTQKEPSENRKEEEEESDPAADTLFNLTQALESSITQDSNLKFSTINVTQLQQHIFKTLDTLYPKLFPNKLIVMRRLSSISGYISYNRTVSNQEERDLCIERLRKSHNSYILGAALIVLSNSINSRHDADLILKQIPLRHFIGLTQYLTDPVQSQGFLDILKKLLNMSNAMFLSGEEETLGRLSSYLTRCSEQCKYFQSLLPLLIALLQKLITVLPSGTVRQLCGKTEFLTLIVQSGTIVSALTLDKLLVSVHADIPGEIIEKLWNTVFRWREEIGISNGNGNIEALTTLTLFQMSKTIGIYLRNCDTNKTVKNMLFTKYSSDLYDVLEAIWLMKDATDKGSMSVFNNGKFIAGMIVSLFEKGKGDGLSAEDKERLESLARKFLLS